MSAYYAEAAAAVAANHKMSTRDVLDIARFACIAMAVITMAVAMI